MGGVAWAAPVVTNVSVVNVTASTFSVVWLTTPGATPAISVFADAGGATNLAGQVGIEYYPLHTGSPTATNAYTRRLSESILRQKTANQGLVQARISLCRPNTTYYFQVLASDGTGAQTVWPAGGPLPSATAAADVDYVIQSRQLAFNLPGVDPSGSIVLLSNSNTASLLAAVAGDGISSNQVFFSLSDLLDASGRTNFLPLGNQTFTATVMGTGGTESQTYSVNFTTDFLVGQGSLVNLSQFAVLSLGTAVVPAGGSGSLPIGVYASGITNLTFTLNLPTNLFRSLSLQSLSAQVGAAALHILNSNLVQATLSAAAGQSLAGDQQLAQLNFTAVSNQPPVFLPLAPFSFQATNLDGSAVANLAVLPGSLVIVNYQPLLQDAIAGDGTRLLSLYGLPGHGYEIQRSTNLVTWSDIIRVPMTNLVQTFSGLSVSGPRVFYRAYEFMADPPLLQASLGGQERTLLIYGRPGTNYVVQYATNLSHVVTWYPLLSTTLTNSFQFLSNVNSTNRAIFYRLKR